MKTKSLFLLAIVLTVVCCQKIKDATSITVSTNLQCSIPVTVQTALNPADLLKSATAYTFNKTQDLALDANIDISPYLTKINQINLKSLVVTISGLTADQTINTITLSVAGVGTVFTQSNITMANNSFTPVIAAGILDQVGAKLKSDHKISFTVSGAASGPMTFTVGLNLDTSVVVYTI